jgi:hypothetical protein
MESPNFVLLAKDADWLVAMRALSGASRSARTRWRTGVVSHCEAMSRWRPLDRDRRADSRANRYHTTGFAGIQQECVEAHFRNTSAISACP